MMNKITQLNQYCEGFNALTNRDFVIAMMKLNANHNFDFMRLLAKLRTSDLKISSRPSERGFLVHLDEIYNFRTSTGQTDIYKSTYENLQRVYGEKGKK